MKKNVLAVLLSVVMTVAGVCAPVYAAESSTADSSTAEPSAAQEAVEDSTEGMTEEIAQEEEPVQVAEEASSIEESADGDEQEPEEGSAMTDADETDSGSVPAGETESLYDDSQIEETAGETESLYDDSQIEETAGETETSERKNGGVVSSGSCGDNLTWTFDEEGTLSIEGTGAMDIPYAYGYGYQAPWSSFKDSIKTIVISEGATNIGDGAFLRCGNLVSVTIPDSVTSIGSYAFSYCSRLTGVVIPDSATIIGDSAFKECRNLESVMIPDSVTSIGDNAFEECRYLREVTIPGSVTKMGKYAFYESGLMSVTIQDGVTSIGDYAFYECTELMSVTIPGSVTNIGEAAFYFCDHLSDVTIPDSVTSIGNSAFFWCKNLLSVMIPDSVTNIGRGAFSGCNRLNNISVHPDNPAYCSIDGVLFNKDQTMLHTCGSGTEGDYYIPDSVTSIGDYAFWGCSYLTSVTIPDSVTSIGENAFTYCDGLTSVTIPAGVTSIGENTFRGCRSLTSITIPDSVTSIGNSAFEECGNLGSVALPAGVTSIGEKAFSECSSLTSITIPDSVTGIGRYAFYQCTSLTGVDIPSGITSIEEGTFCGCDGLTKIVIPDSVTSIADSAFLGCDNLTEVTLPAGVTSIGPYAFSRCSSLTSVTIPAGVTYLGNGAFSDCDSLNRIRFRGNAPKHGYDVFENVTATAYYPEDDPSWKPAARNNLSWDLTWEPYDPSESVLLLDPEFSCDIEKTISVSAAYQSKSSEAINVKVVSDAGDALEISAAVVFDPVMVDELYESRISFTITGKKAGEYHITINTDNGCTASSVITVNASEDELRLESEFTGEFQEPISILATYISKENKAINANVVSDAGDALDISAVVVFEPVKVNELYETRISFTVTGNQTGDYDLTLKAGDGIEAKTTVSVIVSKTINCTKKYFPERGAENVDYTLPIFMYFDMNVIGNGGYAHLYEAGNATPENIRLDAGYVNAHTYTGKDLKLDFQNIKSGKSYYITIDAGALIFYGDASSDSGEQSADSSVQYYSYSGLSTGMWSFSTTETEYLPIVNPNIRSKGEEISKELFNTVFRAPTIADHLYSAQDGKFSHPGGICYGMAYASGANRNNYYLIRQYGLLSKITGDKYKIKGAYLYSLYDYMKMAFIYQLKYEQKKEEDDTKNKFSDIVNSIRSGKQIILMIWDKENTKHALLPIAIADESETEIKVVVYDCNKVKLADGKLPYPATTYLNTITFRKNESKITGFEYSDQSGVKYKNMAYNTLDPEFENIILTVPNTPLDSQEIREEYKGHPLLKIQDEINGEINALKIDCASGDGTEEGSEYYWAEEPFFEETLTTDNSISITDGFDEIEVTADAGASIRLDIENGTAKIENAGAESENYTITHRHADDYDNTQSVVIKGETSSTVNTEKTDDGIIVRNEDDTPIKAEITVTENGEEVAAVDITATTDSVNVVYSNDDGLKVLEDRNSDGTYETDVNTPEEKTIENAEITGISNKQYTGSPVVQSITVISDGVQLEEGTDYIVEYSDNNRPGTATAAITGIGSYTGTVTRTYLILPGKTSRGDMFNLANNVKVTWKEVPGAKCYKVYREGVTDKTETRTEPVIVTSGLVGWDKDPGLTNGHAYRYKIVASLTGKEDPSGDSTLSYSKLMYRLKTVVIRSVKNTAPGKVTVKYDKTTSGDSYVLQYSTSKDMTGAKTKVVLGANNTSYVIGGLKKGKTYYISIRVRKKVNGIDYYTTFGVPKKVTVTK